MNRFASRNWAHGFSLVELLCVMAIVGLLAAMLLPALSKGKSEARRAKCAEYLRQVGIAFHSFAHDHDNKFPMAVAGQAGGSREFAANSRLLRGEFYFAFRHLQTLSNELVTPKLLLCPADTRFAATNFAGLKNENVSYFVGLNAELSRPKSILAGDRNLTNDWSQPGSRLLLGPNSALRWTHELHKFKGNLLFADGHVEQFTSPGLMTQASQSGTPAELALPSVQAIGSGRVPTFATAGGTANGGRSTRGPNANGEVTPSSPTLPAQDGPIPLMSNSASGAGEGLAISTETRNWAAQRGPAAPSPSASDTAPQVSNTVRAPAPGGSPAPSGREDPTAAPFPLWLAGMLIGLVRKGAWLLYGLLLLLAAVALLLRRRARLSPRQPPPPSG